MDTWLKNRLHLKSYSSTPVKLVQNFLIKTVKTSWLATENFQTLLQLLMQSHFSEFSKEHSE